MPRNLEPPCDNSTDWDVLYLARGNEEVVDHRPFLTGDVFADVTVQAPRSDPKTKDVMIIQHPCAMRPNGVELASSLLVAEVHKFPVLRPDKWSGSGKLMPLPSLLAGVTSGRKNQAAFLDDTYHVHPLDLTTRIACLSLRGVNLLLQRWVYHSSRVIVPSFDFDSAVAPVYEQADIIEEWCEIAMGVGCTLDEANYDAHAWLREVDQGRTREKSLEDPQLRPLIRRGARIAASKWRAPSPTPD
jgi:hypothetical protein